MSLPNKSPPSAAVPKLGNHGGKGDDLPPSVAVVATFRNMLLLPDSCCIFPTPIDAPGLKAPTLPHSKSHQMNLIELCGF